MRKIIGYLILLSCFFMFEKKYIFSMEAEDSNKVNQANSNAENDCSICLEPLIHNFKTLKCGNKGKTPHRFHIKCLQLHLKFNYSNCPTCREQMTDEEISFINNYNFDNNGEPIPNKESNEEETQARKFSRNHWMHPDTYVIEADPTSTISDDDVRNARPARPYDYYTREYGDLWGETRSTRPYDDYACQVENVPRDDRSNNDFYQFSRNRYSNDYESNIGIDENCQKSQRSRRNQVASSGGAGGGDDWSLLLEGLNGLGFGYLAKKELFNENTTKNNKIARLVGLLTTFCGTNVILYKLNPERFKKSATYKSMLIGILLGFILSPNESKNKKT